METGNVEVCNALLSSDSIEGVNKEDGRRALDRFLSEYYAPPSTTSHASLLTTFLYRGATLSAENSERIVRLAKGCEAYEPLLLQRDGSGWSPLLIAVSSGQISLLEELSEKKPWEKVKKLLFTSDKLGRTAISVAMHYRGKNFADVASRAQAMEQKYAGRAEVAQAGPRVGAHRGL